jgi:O-methyltransferase
MNIIKNLYRKIIPNKIRYYIYSTKNFIKGNFFITNSNSFIDDGLASNHITDFMKDKNFISAYNKGKKNCSSLKNHNSEIYFRAYIACYCAKHALKIRGDFVECGVGKGLISNIICNYIKINSHKKIFYLIDTFEGIPIQNLNNLEKKNVKYLNQIHFNNNYYNEVIKRFNNFFNVKIIKGRIPEILYKLKVKKVSFLHIDMNNSYAEMSAIKFFFSLVSKGGLILLDDYAYDEMFRSQKNAWDKYAKKKNFDILTLPTGQGLIIKV